MLTEITNICIISDFIDQNENKAGLFSHRSENFCERSSIVVHGFHCAGVVWTTSNDDISLRYVMVFTFLCCFLLQLDYV